MSRFEPNPTVHPRIAAKLRELGDSGRSEARAIAEVLDSVGTEPTDDQPMLMLSILDEFKDWSVTLAAWVQETFLLTHTSEQVIKAKDELLKMLTHGLNCSEVAAVVKDRMSLEVVMDVLCQLLKDRYACCSCGEYHELVVVKPGCKMCSNCAKNYQQKRGEDG